MNQRYLVLVPLAALVIACTTCNTTTTLPAVVTESATSAPSSGTSSGDILLYSDSGGEAGSQIDSFPTTQRKLHFKTKVDSLNKGQKIHWVFTAKLAGTLNNKQISVVDVDVPLDGVTDLSVSLSNDQDWPSGLYKVDLNIDGSLIKSSDYLIAKQ